MPSKNHTETAENLANGTTAAQSLISEVKRLKAGYAKDTFLKLLSGLNDDQIKSLRHAEAVWNGRAAPLLEEVQLLRNQN